MLRTYPGSCHGRLVKFEARIDMPNGTGYPYINVNIMCLDEPDLDAALNAPVTYRDGLCNDWGNPPAQTRHL